jgi:predicted GNAT family N-acyltransferase
MIRHIESNDYFKGYLDLINVFTREPVVKTFEEFKDVLSKIYSQNSEIYVIEKNDKIISSIHLLYEYKVHNNFKLVCHIEDVVTDTEYRNQGYASILLKYAVQKAEEKKCYKIVLSSNENNKQFYINNGFLLKGVELCKYV